MKTIDKTINKSLTLEDVLRCGKEADIKIFHTQQQQKSLILRTRCLLFLLFKVQTQESLNKMSVRCDLFTALLATPILRTAPGNDPAGAKSGPGAVLPFDPGSVFDLSSCDPGRLGCQKLKGTQRESGGVQARSYGNLIKRRTWRCNVHPFRRLLIIFRYDGFQSVPSPN